MSIHDINEAKPHMETSVLCGRCGHKWVAVHPETTYTLECPGCHGWVNEYGTPVGAFTCAVCDRPFSVCPEPDEAWQHCLADDCGSYDPIRDVDRFIDLMRRDDD